MDIELTEPLPDLVYDGVHCQVLALCWLHGEPIEQCLFEIGQHGMTARQLGVLLWAELREPVCRRFASAALPAPSSLGSDGLRVDAAVWPFALAREEILRSAPFISIVIATRDRPEQLAVCLSRLNLQEYPNFEVVVVENVPTGNAVKELIEAQRGGTPYRYLVEERSGLSWARNTGVAAANGEIIAFLDDDDEPDTHWLAGLVRGFQVGEDVGCVTGSTVPAVLDTPAQELYERLGGHTKDRGFERAIFTPDGPQSPLFPLPPFGAGANMAFQKEALAKIGGLDVALGAGTPSLAGADTLAFTLTLLAGYRLVYEPAAVMRHHHRRDVDGLQRQLRGYSAGLTAFYAAVIRHRPDVLPELLRLLPSGVKYLRSGSTDLPPEMVELMTEVDRRHRRGMIMGPVLYAKSLRAQAKLKQGDLGHLTEGERVAG